MTTKTKPQVIKAESIKLPAGFKKEISLFIKPRNATEILRGKDADWITDGYIMLRFLTDMPPSLVDTWAIYCQQTFVEPEGEGGFITKGEAKAMKAMCKMAIALGVGYVVSFRNGVFEVHHRSMHQIDLGAKASLPLWTPQPECTHLIRTTFSPLRLLWLLEIFGGPFTLTLGKDRCDPLGLKVNGMSGILCPLRI